MQVRAFLLQLDYNVVQETACIHILNYHQEMRYFAGTVAARSKGWVYDRSLAGVVGSNPTVSMYACLF
jgi:hypothetical protein